MRLFWAALLTALLSGCAGVLPQVERVPSTTLVAAPDAPLAAAARDAQIPPASRACGRCCRPATRWTRGWR